MSRFAIMLVAALMWAPLLHAAPKDDALAAFQKFFPAFV